MLPFFFRNLLVIILTAALVGCLLHPASITVDPEATFTAHEEHGGIVLDRMQRGAGGLIAPAGWLRAPGSPTFLLRVEEHPVAFFWLPGAGRVVGRPGSNSAEPPSVEVEPSFEAGAVKFAVRRGSGQALRTDTFAREGGGTGPSLLSRNAQTVLDVRGTYRATVRDDAGKPIGWLRASISPYQPSPRIYDARLPADVDDAVPAAITLALRDEIDGIERHALDVYRSSGSSDHLERSIDLGR
jgi:hypothetical protein